MTPECQSIECDRDARLVVRHEAGGEVIARGRYCGDHAASATEQGGRIERQIDQL